VTSARAQRLRRITRVVSALAAGSLLFPLAACSSSSSSASGTSSDAAASGGGIPSGVIKVGLITPLSGELAGLGAGIKAGISTFVSEVNSGGGVDGHQLELITENDQNDPATGVTAAEKLKSEGVVVSFGAGLGPVVAQVLPVLMKEKIVVIFNESTDAYSKDVASYPYYFSSEPVNALDMADMAQYAKSQGVTKVGTITDGLPYSLDNRTDFDAAAKTAGLTVVAQATYSPTAVDLSTQVAQLKAAGAQAIAATTETQLAALYAAVKQLNWNPIILGNQITPLTSPGDATSNTVYPCLGPLKKGQSAPQGTVNAIDALKKAGVQGVAPNLSPIYRDEVQLFVAAAKAAGSVNPDKLKAALETFRNVSYTAPDYKYTYTAGSHAGWAGVSGQCHVTPVSPEGLPYQIGS
jgi:branched-chain amino acid transport system substrate-binding protein